MAEITWKNVGGADTSQALGFNRLGTDLTLGGLDKLQEGVGSLGENLNRNAGITLEQNASYLAHEEKQDKIYLDLKRARNKAEDDKDTAGLEFLEAKNQREYDASINELEKDFELNQSNIQDITYRLNQLKGVTGLELADLDDYMEANNLNPKHYMDVLKAKEELAESRQALQEGLKELNKLRTREDFENDLISIHNRAGKGIKERKTLEDLVIPAAGLSPIQKDAVELNKAITSNQLAALQDDYHTKVAPKESRIAAFRDSYDTVNRNFTTEDEVADEYLKNANVRDSAIFSSGTNKNKLINALKSANIKRAKEGKKQATSYELLDALKRIETEEKWFSGGKQDLTADGLDALNTQLSSLIDNAIIRAESNLDTSEIDSAKKLYRNQETELRKQGRENLLDIHRTSQALQGDYSKKRLQAAGIRLKKQIEALTAK